MKLTRPNPNRQNDGAIALINIVFAMLIVSLVATSLMGPVDSRPDAILASHVERDVQIVTERTAK